MLLIKSIIFSTCHTCLQVPAVITMTVSKGTYRQVSSKVVTIISYSLNSYKTDHQFQGVLSDIQISGIKLPVNKRIKVLWGRHVFICIHPLATKRQ